MKTCLKLISSFAIACAAILCIPYGAFAQGYGSISGTVTDASGAVVPGTVVTATLTGTGLTLKTTSSSDGVYVFPTLAPSVYNLSAVHAGFNTFTDKGLQLRADASLTVNIVFRAGATTETIVVNAETAQVDVTTGTLEQVLGTSQVNDLPLNGRNAASLVAEVAGVTVAPSAQADQGATKTFPVAFTITANGTRVGQTNYLLDGGNNVDEYTNVNAPFPMPDALQEFSVQTSNYNAEYGQNAGGVVNIITKSGTKKYHGDLFEFVRNRYFNAANYFTYLNGIHTVDPLKRNQFGGTVGGPLSIPHLINGNKSFFFFGYQRTVSHTATGASSTLPSAAQRNGTFAGESRCLQDPMNPAAILTVCNATTTFPYTATVDTTAYSPVSLKLLTYLPPVSKLDANNSISYVKPSFSHVGEVTARVDQELSPKDRMTVRYFSDGYSLAGVLDLTNLLTYADHAQINYYNSMVSETHTFSDRLLNVFILSYQIDNAGRGPNAGGISVNDLGVAEVWQPAFKQINSITNGFFSVGDNPQGFFRRSNYTLTDDLHYVRGKHNIAFGYHGEIGKVDVDNLYRQPSNFTFNANNTYDATLSFLLGYVYEFTQASGQFFNARDKFNGGYVQDSWKTTRRLTLNYGVRYEPFVPWHEIRGRMGSFFPTLWSAGTHSTMYPLAPAGLQFAGDAGFNKNGVESSFKHFMPRLGFAWDVFGTGKTSVRGGAGMFFDSRINSTLFNIYTNTSPFITNVDLINSNVGSIRFANPYSSTGTANPFPAPQPPPPTAAIPPQGFLTYDTKNGFQDPLTYSWNLAVEQQMSRSLSVRAAYVGEHSSHEWVPIELNPSIPVSTTPFVAGPRIYNQPGCAATNSCFGSTITEASTSANTNYHSLQLSAEQRMRYGLTLLANYTWSKALDNMPFNAAATSIGAGNSYVYPITVANFKALDHGPSDFDHRNVSTVSYVYTVPKFLASAPASVRFVVNDWATTGLFQFHSGDPLTAISNSSNQSGSGQSRDRAIMTGAPYGGSACIAGTHCKSYLNPASFTIPALGSYGTFVKGSLVGPAYANWDVSIARRFPLKNQAALQFRTEYFNVLNHTNFGDPNMSATGSSFGRITSTSPQNGNYTNDPRIAQFSLKLIF